MPNKLPKAVRDAMECGAIGKHDLLAVFYAGAVFGVKEFLGTSGSKAEVLAKIRRMEKEAGNAKN